MCSQYFLVLSEHELLLREKHQQSWGTRVLGHQGFGAHVPELWCPFEMAYRFFVSTNMGFRNRSLSLYGEAKCQAIMWKDFTDYPHDTQVIHSYLMTPRWEIDILKYQSFVEMFI